MTDIDQEVCGVVRFTDCQGERPCTRRPDHDGVLHRDADGEQWSAVDCVREMREATVLPYQSHPRPGYTPLRVLRADGGDLVIAGSLHSRGSALEFAAAIIRAASDTTSGRGRG